jgi:ATP-dependent RNA helicase RhlE
MELLKRENPERALIFTRTKVRADRLARTLQKAGVSAEAIHSDRAQGQRQNALDGFRSGKHRVLVATDVMARGIDVDDISHVINYDFPEQAEDYVHRIGRTARAGRAGTAISLLAPDEVHKLQEIEAHMGRVLRSTDLEGFHYKPRAVPNPDRKAEKTPRTVFSSGIMRRGRRRY